MFDHEFAVEMLCAKVRKVLGASDLLDADFLARDLALHPKKRGVQVPQPSTPVQNLCTLDQTGYVVEHEQS